MTTNKYLFDYEMLIKFCNMNGLDRLQFKAEFCHLNQQLFGKKHFQNWYRHAKNLPYEPVMYGYPLRYMHRP